MIKKTTLICLFSCCFLTVNTFASSPNKRDEIKPIRTTVAIPCCFKHYKHLYPLLKIYKGQTVLPDEIVISQSDAERIPKNEFYKLERSEWPFAVKIIKTNGRASAGQNRNTATDHCTTDVIIFQDADDIPHPQRVELIKFAFENYYIDHLFHEWISQQDNFVYYEPCDIELVKCDFANQAFYMTPSRWSSKGVTNGNICITTELARKLKWPTYFRIGEDVEFNRAVYDLSVEKAVLRMPLLLYRVHLSSFH